MDVSGSRSLLLCRKSDCYWCTLPEINSHFAHENRPKLNAPKENYIVIQPSIFRCKLLVSGRVILEKFVVMFQQAVWVHGYDGYGSVIQRRCCFFPMITVYTPLKMNMSPKKGTILKGHESSSNQQFSGDMLVFRGKKIWQRIADLNPSDSPIFLSEFLAIFSLPTEGLSWWTSRIHWRITHVILWIDDSGCWTKNMGFYPPNHPC